MSVINKFPSRVKYYLAEWKNENTESFRIKYGNCRLDELSKDQLRELFHTVFNEDMGAIKST